MRPDGQPTRGSGIRDSPPPSCSGSRLRLIPTAFRKARNFERRPCAPRSYGDGLGATVGAVVGGGVGEGTGVRLGFSVGDGVGSVLGEGSAETEGSGEGATEGSGEGAGVICGDGSGVGAGVGSGEGAGVICGDGASVICGAGVTYCVGSGEAGGSVTAGGIVTTVEPSEGAAVTGCTVAGALGSMLAGVTTWGPGRKSDPVAKTKAAPSARTTATVAARTPVVRSVPRRT